jgi:transposase
MAQNFLPCDREQVMLLPPSVADWLPEGHLARFLIEVVDELDLGSVYAAYRADGHGRPAHDPAMMTALLLYNYALGVRGSRAIERRCVEDVACRVIAANRAPDHATIARFRARHEDALSELFYEVLALCRAAGMVSVGTVAVDSTKLAADASLAANRTHGGLRREAKRILAEAAEVDAREDELYGERRGDELPGELADRASRPAKIRELLERARAQAAEVESKRERMLARRAEHKAKTGREPKGRRPGPGPSKKQARALSEAKYNLTDPDSAIVRQRGMLLQGYNVQTAVGEGQVILAARATSSSPDHGQLAPTVDQAEANLARVGVEGTIEQVLADGGYWHAGQITGLKRRGMRVLIPPSERRRRGPETMQPEARAMKALLATDEGGRAYRRRQQIAEPVFAHIKHHRGITRLLRRGRNAVQAEIDLIATTHNLLKLYRHGLQAARA